MKRIFFVEDDLSLINGLSFAIKKQGYEIDIARTSSEAENLWMNGKYDLVILDVSLPDGSGYDLCKKIRQTSKVPIIFLTAADEETDIIMGLDIGGDDYITKPFKLAVFLSRVNALLRRSENFNQADTELNSNGIRIQLLKHEVYKDDVLIDLTASEYKLLCLFMENPNIVLSSEQILSRLWDCEENYIHNIQAFACSQNSACFFFSSDETICYFCQYPRSNCQLLTTERRHRLLCSVTASSLYTHSDATRHYSGHCPFPYNGSLGNAVHTAHLFPFYNLCFPESKF